MEETRTGGAFASWKTAASVSIACTRTTWSVRVGAGRCPGMVPAARCDSCDGRRPEQSSRPSTAEAGAAGRCAMGGTSIGPCTTTRGMAARCTTPDAWRHPRPTTAFDWRPCAPHGLAAASRRATRAPAIRKVGATGWELQTRVEQGPCRKRTAPLRGLPDRVAPRLPQATARAEVPGSVPSGFAANRTDPPRALDARLSESPAGQAERARRTGSAGSASETRWRSATSIAVSSWPGSRVSTSSSPVQRSRSAQASS